MKTLFILLTFVLLSGCAAGVSTYEYRHMADGSTWVKVKSANEIKDMKMGINRETGTLDVEIGSLDKKSEVETVVEGFENVTGNIARILNPIPGG